MFSVDGDTLENLLCTPLTNEKGDAASRAIVGHTSQTVPSVRCNGEASREILLA